MVSETGQGGKNVPRKGGLVWGVRMQQGGRGLPPGEQRSHMQCWSPSEEKRSAWESGWGRMGESAYKSNKYIKTVGKKNKKTLEARFLIVRKGSYKYIEKT